MWEVITTDVFDEWYLAQDKAVRVNVLAAIGILEESGPLLGRPYVDTLNGSEFANMKELRIQHAGDPIRAFFIFAPSRRAIILCAGCKAGQNEKSFYQKMIRLAESEYYKHLSCQRN
ncbi:type II toxin-antitoxin system RelE/ParE family toxin [Buttiauxella izardii]|uniref:Type II toxin-antitoxin system RelE/ParE family toxin n=1 Tax=Buttiauxella izardii TaxID=82991 RepID=A0A3A5JQ10_9ENTR|nr:type II toxin-antitoxin system RelE/ParE family toxin [Buttiauxella izardii]RJT20780.1 type II toxin-antitoxin system RelE/ParE family toxin [Buttiauxella izardii]